MTAPLPVEHVFEIRGLSKIYRMGEVEVRALRGVDLDVIGGEFLVLLGHSGSGKSTLLNIVGGLDTPSAGTVRYRDHELTTAADAELTAFRRDHVGFVFQFYNLIPSLTARENVELITDIAARPMRRRRRWRWSACRNASITFPRSCRAASSSVWQSREPSPSAPTSCFATNRRARSTSRPAPRC
jgi:ABC-type lipoprotein export system ATPase subunit